MLDANETRNIDALANDPDGRGNGRDSAISEAVMVRVADVPPESIQWFWRGRMALGKVTLLAGDPGLGKSFVALDMAARVSVGAAWPDQPGETAPKGSVVLLSAEDDIGDTIRPRLDAAGADVGRIHVLQMIRRYDSDSESHTLDLFSLQKDIPALDKAIEAAGDCRLVIIDPVTAYLGSTDSHKNAEIRGLLAPIADMVSRRGVAVVAVTHLNKRGAGPAMYRAMGSLAFVAAARSVWCISKDPDDQDRRLFLPVKNNISRGVQGMAYPIVPSESDPEMGVVAWEKDPVAIDADAALAPTDDGVERSSRDEATEWLRQVLIDGKVATKDLQRLAGQAGHKWATVRRARSELSIETVREGFGKGATWFWVLSDHRCSPDPIDAQQKDLSTYDDREHLCGDGDGDWGEI